MKVRLLFLVLFFCTISYSCDDEDHPIPDVYVDFKYSINNSQYAALQNPGGYAYVTGGYAGICIYNLDGETFYAFDRGCTYNKKHSPLIFNEKENCMMHSDTLADCNSKYNVLLQGAVMSGVAKYGLKRYSASLKGGYVYVYNDDYTNY